MILYVIRRIAYAVPILIGVCFFTFWLFYLSSTPEAMARRNISAKHPTHRQITQWIHLHGYDKPKFVQLKDYVYAMFTFHFGKSDTTGEDITQRLKEGVWPSTQIGLVMFVGGLLTDIFFAIYFAYYRGTYIDTWGRSVCVIMMSITYPTYIIAGQYFLGKSLMLSPIAGYRPGWESWKFVVLPAIVGIVSGYGASVRLYRTFVLEEINLDYVRTARAKGVPEGAVLFKHVLKNAAIPIISSVVLSIPFLITGNLLLESYFGIPGIGSITRDAIFGQDFTTVRATAFLYTLLYITGAIATDVCYAAVDPRVRLE